MLSGLKVGNKKRTISVILFFIAVVCLWVFLLIATGHKISDHSYYDQHTLQAKAWLNGHIYLNDPPAHLELAHYNNKIYVSFPPVPTVLQIPLVIIWQNNTPNTLFLLIMTFFSMIIACFILHKFNRNQLLSINLALGVIWGTNAMYLSLSGAVWHQGQLMALFFNLLALLFIANGSKYKKIWIIFSGFALSLAVGCRPLSLFLAFLYGYLIYKKNDSAEALIYFVVGMVPVGIALGLYNLIRFDSPLNFGHRYLNYESQLSHGVFSFHYLGTNLYHAFLHLPERVAGRNFVSFHGRGTAIWFISPVLFLGFTYYFKRDIQIREKIAVSVSLILIWGALLLHHSNGWFQFGYRYSVDMIPVFLFILSRSFKRNYPAITGIVLFSMVINIYGAIWFYLLPK